MSDDREAPSHIGADAARGGEIILRTRRQRAIFIGGLIGAGILTLALALG